MIISTLILKDNMKSPCLVNSSHWNAHCFLPPTTSLFCGQWSWNHIDMFNYQGSNLYWFLEWPKKQLPTQYEANSSFANKWTGLLIHLAHSKWSGEPGWEKRAMEPWWVSQLWKSDILRTYLVSPVLTQRPTISLNFPDFYPFSVKWYNDIHRKQLCKTPCSTIDV